MANTYLKLSCDENQAQGIAQYAIEFCAGEYDGPTDEVLQRTELFHLDSVGCAVAALAIRANAPIVLRAEAMEYPLVSGASCFGSSAKVQPEKAVLANSSAARELDSNGTNFGFNPRTGYTRGEFGHNDFYPVIIAASGAGEFDGAKALRAMTCLDEIRDQAAD